MNQAMEGISFSAYIMAPAVPISILSMGLATSNTDATIGGLQIGAGILLSTATTLAMKKLLQRPRPYDSYPDLLHPLAHESSYSFPSGHTSVAFATATSLSLQFQKWYITLPAFLWATAVGYSRMYLGVHYPSDVLIGIVVGMTTAYLSYKVQQWIKPQVQTPISIRF
jgi:undecaprenyl-diphosphatase